MCQFRFLRNMDNLQTSENETMLYINLFIQPFLSLATDVIEEVDLLLV